MQTALIIGHTGGIGSAMLQALNARGTHVQGISRSSGDFDLLNPTTLHDALENINQTFDLIFVATGALQINEGQPEKTIKAIDHTSMAEQFCVNAIGPAITLSHAQRLLNKHNRSVFAALSARVGSIGDNNIGGWVSYRAAKAALNQIIHTAAIELARTHPKSACVCLHPGTVETSFTRKYLGRHPSVPAITAATNLLDVIDGLGPEKTGQFFDYSGKIIPW